MNSIHKELNLIDIKCTALDLLIHFKNFCQDNNIRFFLSNGTLLGAIKYKGFIPWDDDIDVLVPREDYDKLIAVYRDNGCYRLFSQERESGFKFPFAKLCNITTIKLEENVDNGVQLGIDIDIFPLDDCTSHICRFYIQSKIKLFFRGCVLAKLISSSGKPFYKRWIINYCRRRGYNWFNEHFEKQIKREASFGATHKGCLIWPVYGEREILPADVFSETIYIEFEGEKFPAPIGYDTYLRSLYGNYELDPPLEKQKTHHSFIAYRI